MFRLSIIGLPLTALALLLAATTAFNGSALAGETTATSTTTTTVENTTTPEDTTTAEVTVTPGITVTATPPSGEGCTPGFWKNHTSAWVGYTTGQELDTVFNLGVFDAALGDDSLLEALSYGGGSTNQAAAQLLLHHAVAALLNASHPDVDYPQSTASIIAAVNAALASNDRATILAAKNVLSSQNEAGCPINGR